MKWLKNFWSLFVSTDAQCDCCEAWGMNNAVAQKNCICQEIKETPASPSTPPMIHDHTEESRIHLM